MPGNIITNHEPPWMFLIVFLFFAPIRRNSKFLMEASDRTAQNCLPGGIAVSSLVI